MKTRICKSCGKIIKQLVPLSVKLYLENTQGIEKNYMEMD